MVDVNQLLTLPEHLLQIPAQVVETFICGIKPCDGDVDWPEEVRTYILYITLYIQTPGTGDGLA